MKKLNGVDARAPTGTLISHTIALSPPALSLSPADVRSVRLDTWVIFQSRFAAARPTPTSSSPSFFALSLFHFFITLARRRCRLNCASDWNFKSCSLPGIFFCLVGPDMAEDDVQRGLFL